MQSATVELSDKELEGAAGGRGNGGGFCWLPTITNRDC